MFVMRMSLLLLLLSVATGSEAASAAAGDSSAPAVATAAAAAGVTGFWKNKKNALVSKNERVLFPSKDGAGFLSLVRDIGRDSIRRHLRNNPHLQEQVQEQQQPRDEEQGEEERRGGHRGMLIVDGNEDKRLGGALGNNNPGLNRLCESLLNMEFRGYYCDGDNEGDGGYFFEYADFSSDDYDCECDIDIDSFGSASMEATCMFVRDICYSEVENRTEDDGLLNVTTNTTVCGIPSVGASLEVTDFFTEIKVTGESCIYNWTMTSDVTTDNLVTNTTNQVVTESEMDDICASASLCSDWEDDDQDGKYIEYCNCNVTIGEVPCNECTICRTEGSDAEIYSPIGITLDCSNINAEAVISNCSVFDIDILGVASSSTSSSSVSKSSLMEIDAGTVLSMEGRDESPVTLFLPSFLGSGFCSLIERKVGNTVTCDCESSGGSTFSVNCSSTTDMCVQYIDDDGTENYLCAMTEASVNVTNGALDSVKTCADVTETSLYDSQDMDLAKTCVEFDMCDDNDDKLICGCTITYDGTECNKCEVCGDDGAAISINCSNIEVLDNLGNQYRWAPPLGAGLCQDVVLPSGPLSSSSTARPTSSVENFVPLLALERKTDGETDGDANSSNSDNEAGNEADNDEDGGGEMSRLNELCESILNMEFQGYYSDDGDFQYSSLSPDDYNCTCDIDLSTIGSAYMEATCTFLHNICYSQVDNRTEDDLLHVSTNTTVCGIPSVSASLEATNMYTNLTVAGGACVYNWTMSSTVTTINQITGRTNEVATESEMDDLCASASICSDWRDEDQDGNYIEFCDCSVTVGDVPCNGCNICRIEGLDAERYSPIGIDLDCSNINAEIVIDSCNVFDINLWGVAPPDSSSAQQNLRNVDVGGGIVGGLPVDGRTGDPVTLFMPSFSDGFCSVIEKKVGDTVACDCESSGGSTFSVNCSSTTDICIQHVDEDGTDKYLCAMTEASVNVIDGAVDNVKTCADITNTSLYDDEDMDLAKTCVQFDMCDDDDDEDKLICGCKITYDGTECTKCEVCGDDGAAISVNCSNIEVLDNLGNKYQRTPPSGANLCQDVVLPNDPLSSFSTARETSSFENFVTLLALERKLVEDGGDGGDGSTNNDGDGDGEGGDGGDDANNANKTNGETSAATAGMATTMVRIICSIVVAASTIGWL